MFLNLGRASDRDASRGGEKIMKESGATLPLSPQHSYYQKTLRCRVSAFYAASQAFFLMENFWSPDRVSLKISFRMKSNTTAPPRAMRRLQILKSKALSGSVT